MLGLPATHGGWHHDTLVLVTNVQRTLVDRARPFIVAALGPSVARGITISEAVGRCAP
jgi:hypothetical protein